MMVNLACTRPPPSHSPASKEAASDGQLILHPDPPPPFPRSDRGGRLDYRDIKEDLETIALVEDQLSLGEDTSHSPWRLGHDGVLLEY